MSRKESLAVYVLCLGALITEVDASIVTMAVNSIAEGLQMEGPAVAWLLNAYTLPFALLLIPGGRFGDYSGRRRMFLVGVALFVLSSLACGLARTGQVLLFARAAQGVAAALISSMSLAMIVNLFREPSERLRATAIYGFICSIGVGLGELSGGLITQMLNWRWVFLVNVPIGLAVFFATRLLIAPDRRPNDPKRRPRMGTALRIWPGARLARNTLIANAIWILCSGGTFAWFVLSALYLQRVLNYNALEVAFALLVPTLLSAALSTTVSTSLVKRFGARLPIWVGLSLTSLGFIAFAKTPLSGDFVVDVLPGLLLQGTGAGFATTPLYLAATDDSAESNPGLASGIVNTSVLLGAAIGLASMSSVSDWRTLDLEQQGVSPLAALTSGYHWAFSGCAILTALAAATSAVSLPAMRTRAIVVPARLQAGPS